MSVNLGQIRTFLAVAEAGGVAAAANALGVSRPAVTMQVKALEKEIGRPLFDRSGHALTINAAGQAFQAHAARLLRIAARTEAEMHRLRDPGCGRLAIGACAPFVLVKLVAEFRRRWPSVAVDSEIANSAALRQGVESGRLDIAIGTLPAPIAGLVSLPLLSQRVCAVIRRDDPLAARPSLALADVVDLPTLIREPGSMTRAIVADALAARGLSLSRPAVFGSREAVKEAAASGLGVAFVLSHEVGQDARLAAVPLEGEDLEATEWLLCHPDLVDLSLVREMIGVATDCFPAASGRA